MAKRGDSRAEVLLRAWLEADPSAAARVDVAGRYQAMNQPMREALGLGQTSIAGTSRGALLRERLLPRLTDPAPLAAYLTRVEEGQQDSIELSLIERAAPRRAWIYHSQPLLDPAGELLGWRETLAETTPTEHLQRRSNEQSRAAVGLRRELEERLRTKEEFNARVSHELRTPLTAIIGFCHMLLHYSGQLQPIQREFVQKVYKNASVLLQLLNNVLDLAKMESGEVTAMEEPVDLRSVVREAIETVEPQTWEKSLTIAVELEEPPTVHSDRLKIKQILINLISNAVKYTEEGQVTLSGTVVDGGFELRVSDTGAGIPADQIGRIFDDYVQVNHGPRRVVGTGLGLSICRRLATVLHARLSVVSEEGEGSTFTLWLPLRPPQDPAPRA
ncbi:MAG: PAS domain-containing protein [Armatimonadetes bacterium]|nr:PAS domain-containing protein [Armatimonadota bacterium]